MSNNWKSPLADHYGIPCQIGSNDGCECAQSFADSEKEYNAIRNSVALSDNCHYGKFRVVGSGALDMMNRLVMADVARLAIGRATWTFMLRADGSTLCDVYVVCAGDEYLLYSEGVSPAEVLAVLHSEAQSHSVQVEDLTQKVALIGLDGPFSWEMLKDLVGVRMLGLRYLEFLEKQPLGAGDAYVIRAGKTGEFGYQIMVPIEQAVTTWQQLMAAGERYDAYPAGFDVQHVCRLENRFINMHREGAAVKNPLELNCRVMIDREKDDYIGQDALAEAIDSGLENRIIGLEIDGGSESTPELGADVLHGDERLGKIVNVAFSPNLKKPIALALLAAEVAYVGLDFQVQLDSGTAEARTVSAPFIFNRSMTVRPQEDSYHSR